MFLLPILGLLSLIVSFESQTLNAKYIAAVHAYYHAYHDTNLSIPSFRLRDNSVHVYDFSPFLERYVHQF